MNKRVISLVLMFALLFTGLGNVSLAAERGSANPAVESRANGAKAEADEIKSQPTVKETVLPTSGTISNNDMGIWWEIDKDGNLTVSGNGEIYPKDVDVSSLKGGEFETYIPWLKYRTQIKSAQVVLGNIEYLRGLFHHCSNMKEVNLEKLNTEKVTDMSYMFQNCRSLTSLDVSGFDTSRVRSMSRMFETCSSLTSLDVSGFNTSQVEDISHMFRQCSGLTSLDVSGFDTSQVESMCAMFRECEGLESLDVSRFDTSRVRNMSYMFTLCSGLTSLDVSRFDTSQVEDISYMFADCSGLEELDVSRFDTSRITSMSHMFSGCSGLEELDVSRFDTSQVKSMNAMFSECSGLTMLDISRFDTSQVEDISHMFADCSGLTTLDINRFDTSRVMNINHLFDGCSSLTSLDVSGFDTSRVMNMNNMFSGCSGLTELDVSGFDTSQVEDISHMFESCSGLTELDVSGFDTSQVDDMSSMFEECNGLTELDVSGFNTRKVEDMSSMFRRCINLTSLDVSNFNTKKTRHFHKMFNHCDRLKVLDLSSFDMSEISSWGFGLEYSPALEKVYAPLNVSGIGKLPYTMYKVENGNETALERLPMGLKKSVILTKESVSGNISNEITLSVQGKSFKPVIRMALYDSLGTLPFENISRIELTLDGEVILSGTDWKELYDGTTNVLKYSTKGMLREGEHVVTATLFDVNGGKIFQEKSFTVILPSFYEETINIDKGSVYWKIDRKGKLTVRGKGDISRALTKPEDIPWNIFAHKAVSAQIDLKECSDLSYFFYGCSNLKEVDLQSLDTSATVSMNSMFALCENLEELDMSCMDMASVTLAEDFLVSANSLKKIYTPLNLGVEIELPQSEEGIGWYDISGMEHKGLPKGRDSGLMLILGEKPETMTYQVTVSDNRPVYTIRFHEFIDPLNEISELTLETRKAGAFEWNNLPWENWKEAYDNESRSVTYISGDEYEVGEYESRITVSVEGEYGKLDLTREVGFTIEKDNLGEGGDDDGSGSGSGDGPGRGDGDDDESGDGDDDGSGSDNDGPGSGDGDDDGSGSDNDGPGILVPEGLWVTGIEREYEYTGSSIKPDIKVYDGRGQLVEKKEYTVIHKNNKDAYEAEDQGKKAPYVEVRMKGNNKGSTRIYYKIMKRDISDVMLVRDQLTAAANKSKTANVIPSLFWQGKKLKANKDFEVVGNTKKLPTGSHTITIQGMGNFTGKIEDIPVLVHDGTFEGNTAIAMNKLKIKTAEKKLTWKKEGAVFTDFSFTGKPTVPAEGEYTYEYFFHKAAGTGYLVVRGTGTDANGDGQVFVGTKTLSFKIEGIAMNARNITFLGFEGMEYDHGTAIRPTEMRKEDGTYAATLSSSQGIMTEGEDYTAVYSKNIEKGTGTVTFTGNPEKGYTGSIKKTFKIAPAALSPSEYEVQVSGNDIREENGIYYLSFTKQGTTPEITITAPGGKKLVSGKDYTVKYTGNKKMGETATAIVKGKGNYDGQLEIRFVPEQKEFTDENGIQVVARDKTDNGKPNNWKTTIKILDSNGKALSGKEYEIVSYIITDAKDLSRIGTELENKSQAQTGDEITVTVKGKGDYAAANPEAAATGTYRILEKGYDISKASFKIKTRDYTGEAIEITGQEDFEKATINPGKKPIALGTDFQIVEGSYVKNVDKGTAKVTLQGIGNYGGTKTVTFKILPRETTDKLMIEWN